MHNRLPPTRVLLPHTCNLKFSHVTYTILRSRVGLLWQGYQNTEGVGPIGLVIRVEGFYVEVLQP